MSAECEKCGTDLVGTQWDEGGLSCRVCDLEAEVARLKRDRTHLFESIDKTLDALAVALGAAAVSPEHTDSPAKYVKILAEERDDYKAKVEGMQAEGCAALGLLENIFNGLTTRGKPVDPVLAQMAEAIAKLLTEATPCEHKARAERQELEWDFLCSLLKTFAEGLDSGRRKGLLALPGRARAAIAATPEEAREREGLRAR